MVNQQLSPKLTVIYSNLQIVYLTVYTETTSNRQVIYRWSNNNPQMVNQQLSPKLTVTYRHSTQSLQQSTGSLLNNLHRDYSKPIDN
jgi:hypothetical protein